jgi:hypothetical protein
MPDAGGDPDFHSFSTTSVRKWRAEALHCFLITGVAGAEGLIILYLAIV